MIDIINLHKGFGEQRVLRGVNLTVEKGESMTVIGGSGSGKSVLLKHIIGLLFPDQGRVIIDGQELNNLDQHGLNEVRKKFGMLFQMAALFDSLSVWENVGFALKQHTKMSDREIRDMATEKLALVGLKGIEDKMPAELSGGMKKRVGLARAIAINPSTI
jgi:phospholipid/cholesterol/gamma-HCH transport system ATP-binding protein